MTTIDVSKQPTELVDINQLKPSATNSKKHPAEHIKKLAESIARFGIANTIQIEPAVWADGETNSTPYTIIAGHGRWLAAKSLSWTHVNVIVRTDLTRLEAAALRVSDNQTVWDEYDTELLKQEVMLLQEQDFDLTGLGFDDDELTKLTSDFSSLDDSSFVEDITDAVETQKTDNKVAEAAVDQSSAPVGDAFGFKRVTVEQSRAVRGFMSAVEARTGLKGAEALVKFIADQKLAA